MKTKYKLASKSKTLQELFSTPGTFIQVGQKKYESVRVNVQNRLFRAAQKHFIPKSTFSDVDLDDPIPREHDLLIPLLPNYYLVNKDYELVSTTENIRFKQEKSGLLSLIIENNCPKLLPPQFDEVQIQENLIWIWQDGQPSKAYYYAMDKRFIMDADSHKPVLFISELEKVSSK